MNHIPWRRAGVVAIALLCLGSGWTDDWSSIRAAAHDIQSIRADFVQSKHLKILAKPLISKGFFYYQRPESIRWEYQTPIQSVLLVNAQGVERYVGHGGKLRPDASADLEVMRTVLTEIRQWFGGRFSESRTFEAVRPPKRPNVVRLLPRQVEMTRFIRHIDILLSDTPGLVQAIDIVESDDASTHIEFSGAKLNEPLAAALFTAVEHPPRVAAPP